MCQFAVTHEVPLPSELAKMCKNKQTKNSKIPVERERSFFGSVHFHLRSLSYFYYYPTVQYSHDSSHLLIVLLLWSTGDGNWRFSAGCYHAVMIFRSFFIHDNEKLLRSRSVTQKDFTSVFGLLSLISHGDISNKGQLALLVSFFSSRCLRRQRANNAERGDNNTFGSKWRSWLR